MSCPTCNDIQCQYLNGSKTLALSHQFYDMNGQFHNHDGNTETHHFRCSNGHFFTEEINNKCWCGWPDNNNYVMPIKNDLSYFPTQ